MKNKEEIKENNKKFNEMWYKLPNYMQAKYRLLGIEDWNTFIYWRDINNNNKHI